MLEPDDLDPPDVRLGVLRWIIVGLLAVGFGACIAEGANNPSDPRTIEATIRGYGEVGIRIMPADNPSPTERCALLAATDRQRQGGLMQITDLEGYVGMVFRYPNDSTGGFFMRNTPMPLSIAFFAADGSFVSAADMVPCEDRPDCPVTSAGGSYRYALEVPQGQLGPLGIGPGSTLVLSPRCPAA